MVIDFEKIAEALLECSVLIVLQLKFVQHE